MIDSFPESINMTNPEQQPSNKVGFIKSFLFFCAGIEKEMALLIAVWKSV